MPMAMLLNMVKFNIMVECKESTTAPEGMESKMSGVQAQGNYDHSKERPGAGFMKNLKLSQTQG